MVNKLSRPITVRSITADLDPAFPAPPSGCSRDKLSLPTFSGSLTVPGRGTAVSAGLPIALKDTRTDQDNCQQTVLHFRFTGAAISPTGAQPLPDTGSELGVQQIIWILLTGSGLVVIGCYLILVSRRERRHGGASR